MSTPTAPAARASSEGSRFPRLRGLLVDAGASRESVLAAAVAVGVLLVVKFAVSLVQLLGNAIAYDPSLYANGFLASPVGLFLGSLVLYPFFFYLVAFAVLAFATPILRRTPLAVVLGRALVAGAAGTIALALAGIVTGVAMAASTRNAVAIPLYVVFIPLSTGVQLTAILVAGAAVARVWLRRVGPLGPQEPRSTEASVEASPEHPAAPPSHPSAPTDSLAGSPGAAAEAGPVSTPRPPAPPAFVAPTPVPQVGRSADEGDHSRFAPPAG
ncbi:hypothetical protein AS850_05225 [Frondihabitans sp. 762G35]|uniref:hypothetical protein n=1 Tax=Frondihabitans sp. 762G35 TaxID=1446794 RepID=UPI000D2136A9|nr:hypothetical protein [Frondihabitans sp. 762G35]ARC56474.1 hypothetical protein AS850_05225 [Frondihabitans sp. 762G35]